MKKSLAIIIMCFVCCMAYAQKYIVVHQGANTQQFLLSEVDSISHYGDNSVDLYHNGQKNPFAVSSVDSISIKNNMPNEIQDIQIINVIDWDVVHSTCSGYKLLSFLDETAITKGDNNISTPSVICNRPQIILLLNEDGDIVLMSKGVYNDGDTNTMNTRSTAIALVSAHPIFGYIPSSDYETLVQIITSSKYFDALEAAIKESLEQGKSLFANNDLVLNAYNTLMEDLTSFDPDNSDNSLDVVQMARAARRQVTNISDLTNVGPFQMYVIDNKLMIYTTFVTPFYEGTVSSVYGSARLDIPSGEGLGIVNMLNQPVEQNPDVTFDFNRYREGEYKFHFDRTTARANTDFAFHIIGDVLDVLGLPLSRLETTSLIEAILKNADQMGLDIDGTLYGGGIGSPDPLKTIEIATNAVLNFFGTPEFTQFMARNGRLIAARTFLNRVSGILTWYQAIRGSTNTIARIVLRQNSPKTIDFRLCYYNDFVESCTEVKLEKSGGDNQEGYKGERLLNALEVQVFTYADDGSLVEDRDNYYRVKYSIESGNGRLSWDEANVSYGFATTYWWLGHDDGEQKVRACVVDIATGKEISEPIYFTARASEKTNITFRLDWDRTLSKTDIDLHVYCPKGHHIYYQCMSCPCGGQLDRDDTQGPGPEHIRFNNAEPGEYKVYVHHYESDSKANIGYTVTTTTNERTYRNVGSVSYHAMNPVGKLTIPEPHSNAKRNSVKKQIDDGCMEDIEGAIITVPVLPAKK